MLRADLKKPILYNCFKRGFTYFTYDMSTIDIELKSTKLFSSLDNSMIMAKYKNNIYNITGIEYPDECKGFIFINGSLAIYYDIGTINVSTAVVEYSKIYSTFVNYFLKNLLKYKYSYVEPLIVRKNTLKDCAVLLNVPIEWGKTKRLKTRRLQPTTTSDSVQS